MNDIVVQEDMIIADAMDILEKRIQTPNTLIANPNDIHNYLALMLGERDREHFGAVFLDNSNGVIHTKIFFSGTVHSVHVHPREIIKEALAYNASKIILFHNHPSHAKPSKNDVELTESLIESANLFEITVLDHLIINGHKCYSMATEQPVMFL